MSFFSVNFAVFLLFSFSVCCVSFDRNLLCRGIKHPITAVVLRFLRVDTIVHRVEHLRCAFARALWLLLAFCSCISCSFEKNSTQQPTVLSLAWFAVVSGMCRSTHAQVHQRPSVRYALCVYVCVVAFVGSVCEGAREACLVQLKHKSPGDRRYDYTYTYIVVHIPAPTRPTHTQRHSHAHARTCTHTHTYLSALSLHCPGSRVTLYSPFWCGTPLEPKQYFVLCFCLTLVCLSLSLSFFLSHVCCSVVTFFSGCTVHARRADCQHGLLHQRTVLLNVCVPVRVSVRVSV